MGLAPADMCETGREDKPGGELGELTQWAVVSAGRQVSQS